MRQAFGGMLWCKQLYYYDVERWLDGDPAQPPPPERGCTGRNSRWRSFDAFDIMSMPDKWEYPWFAAWDLAFHCVALAHVDPAFAKYQLILLCREWFQHPNGALPAYEWDFGDVNPPVQAWAALEVFAVDGGTRHRLPQPGLRQAAGQLHLVDQPRGRRGQQPVRGRLPRPGQHRPDRPVAPAGRRDPRAVGRDRLDGLLRDGDGDHRARRCTGPASGQAPTWSMKFLEHFAAIRDALDGLGLWDEADGMYYDRLITPSGQERAGAGALGAGMIPAIALGVIDQGSIERSMAVGKRFAGFLAGQEEATAEQVRGEPGHQRLLLSLAGPDKLARLLARLFDESEFLSPHGIRALSAWHREHPLAFDIEGYRASIDYEPAESTTPLFGGNSNWRGPVWFPVNYLIISALDRYHRFFGDDLVIEYPTGSGRELTLDVIAADLSDRLIAIFARNAAGHRPCFGGTEPFLSDPAWRDNLLFSEYFQGDDGAGLGASHQTGWTGLVADLIRRRGGMVRGSADIIADIARSAGSRLSH